MKNPLTTAILRNDQAQELLEQFHLQAFESATSPELIYQYNTGRIAQANESSCALFGCTSIELLKKKYKDLFVEQKGMIQKMQRQLVDSGISNLVVYLSDKAGNTISFMANANLFYAETGKRFVKLVLVPSIDIEMAVAAPAERKKSEKKGDSPNIRSHGDNKLLQKTDWIKYIASTSYDLMWDWDIRSGDIYVGESIQQVLGFSLMNNCITYEVFIHHISANDKIRVEDKLQKTLNSLDLFWDDKFLIKKSDGTFASTMSRASIVRDDEGAAIRLIGAMQDVSKLRHLEKKLKRQSSRHKAIEKLDKERRLELELKLDDEIRSKEIGIASAVVDAQELQRSEIGRELHDNVNQLLGASRLYLDMARTEEGDVSLYLLRSDEYSALAIQAIRDLSKDLTTDLISDFGLLMSIDKLAIDTMQSSAVKINYVIDQQLDEMLNLKFKLNIFRIIQELVNNILKHAKSDHVTIQLSKNKFAIILTITDDGLGFDMVKQTEGIGLINIKSRSTLFNGAVTMISHPGEGCTIKVTFPINKILFNS